MSGATITIDMDGAAFEHDATGELCRILHTLANGLANYPERTIRNGNNLRDINGNTVGTFKVEG